MTSCPAPELLERLLGEQLADAEREAVEAHVEGCAACQQALGRMAGGLAGPRRERRSGHPPGTGLLRRLEEALPRPPAERASAGPTPPAGCAAPEDGGWP